MEEDKYDGISSNNSGYVASSALQIRLETKELLEDIELFLRGQRINIKEGKKGFIAERIKVGTPKANDAGIQNILNWVRMMINAQTVQGNFPVDSPNHSSKYEDYICYTRKEVSASMTINRIKWEINSDDYDDIIDTLMRLIEPFMTRLIDNKERESYESTIRHVESNTMKEMGGNNSPFGLFR